MRRRLAAAVLLLMLTPPAARAQDGGTPAENAAVQPVLETVFAFHGPMPTGVSVSHEGRVFVNFPRWGDKVPYTVAEIKDGHTVPFPDAAHNANRREDPFNHLVSVQSIVVDPKDRLWLLDTGSIQFGPSQMGGPKLVGVDLATNKVFRVIYFPRDVVPATSYLNDVRFDLRRGRGGLAYITDSGEHGPNGIVVVDLGTGHSWRRLAYQKSVRADYHFVPIVEGQPLRPRPKVGPPGYLKLGSDGIAISADGKRLFYCPLASRELYSVSVDALSNPKTTEKQTQATVKDEGARPSAADGLETGADGTLYATAYEMRGILERKPGGDWKTLVQDPRIVWPDTMSVATNGYLYFTSNQLDRMANYHNGLDMRTRPFYLFRVKVDARPVSLKSGK